MPLSRLNARNGSAKLLANHLPVAPDPITIHNSINEAHGASRSRRRRAINSTAHASSTPASSRCPAAREL